jgi:hypothetical protein
MFTWTFWKAVLERSLWTFVQAFLGPLTAAALLTDVDWLLLLNGAALAFIIAVLKNVGVAMATDGSPSTVNAEKLSPVSVKP